MNNISEQDFVKFPICVDLDGTLWEGDCLWLCLADFFKHHPLKIFCVLFWWYRGRTHLKYNLLKFVSFKPERLSFFPEILSYLHDLKKKGAKIYLVTGSDQKIADAVSAHLNIFEKAFGSSLDCNLVGHNKADLLNKIFGKKNYIYFGNEWKDRFVWEHCVAAAAVDIDQKTSNWLRSQSIYIRRFFCKPSKKSSFICQP